MKVFSTIAELCKQLDSDRNAGKKIGLVPTMGALHNGHLQLVKTSVANNDVTVVSIFVNPTQFNDKNDLLLYPRTLDKDCQLLESVNCDYAFAPSVEEIYPTEDTRTFHLGKVAEVMEGKYRPGHFNGVAQIVSKLFDIVNPDNAYFGEKDFQQIAVIRAMAAQCRNVHSQAFVQNSDLLFCKLPQYTFENLRFSNRRILNRSQQSHFNKGLPRHSTRTRVLHSSAEISGRLHFRLSRI